MNITSQMRDYLKPSDKYQQWFYYKIRFLEFTFEPREN